jgi:ribonucleoside-triphosphate reductase
MRKKLSDYQVQYGDLYNLEATPAESTTYRFAKHDAKDFPDIKSAAKNGGAPFYTNSSHLPVGYTDDVFKALEIEDPLQVLYTSGTVFHAFLGERIPDWKSAASLVRKIATNFKLPYFTLSPTYSVCAKDGYIAGEHFKCPKCGGDAEVYSRITGYYRPIKNWNDGKANEFMSRKTYTPSELFGKETINAADYATKDDKSIVAASTPIDPNIGKGKTEEGRSLVLLSTKTCPNCKLAKNFLSEAGWNYRVEYVEDADGRETAEELGITSAPTLVVRDKGNTKLYENVSNIRGFIMEEEKKQA